MTRSRFRHRAVCIFGRIKTALRRSQLALDVGENIARQPGKHFPSASLLRLKVIERDLRLVVEHFFEMRDKPLLIDRIPVKSTAHMIVKATLGHFLQGIFAHSHRRRAKFGLRTLQGGDAEKEIDHRGARKLRRATKAAPLLIVSLVEILVTFLKSVAGRFVQWHRRTRGRNFARNTFVPYRRKRELHHFLRTGYDFRAITPANVAQWHSAPRRSPGGRAGHQAGK